MSALVVALVWCVLGFVAGWFSHVTRDAWTSFHREWQRGQVQGLRDAGRLCVVLQEQLREQDTTEAKASVAVLEFTRVQLFTTALALEKKVTP